VWFIMFVCVACARVIHYIFMCLCSCGSLYMCVLPVLV